MNMDSRPITHGAWRLPWRDAWVPHALLDILRGCNITCRACYNATASKAKSLHDIRTEFEALRRLRRLDSVSIVGGEPLLHPDLPAVIRLIKAAGISVELFTNGLRLTPDGLIRIKDAGADMVFLHIDAQQTRPDLPCPNPEALRSLRAATASKVTAAGLEAGLAITAYPDALEEIDAAADLVLTSPDLDYLLITLHRDTPALGPLQGDIVNGMRGHRPGSSPQPRGDLSIAAIHHRLHARFGLVPFAYIGANTSGEDPRWLSYLVASIVHPSRPSRWRAMTPSAIEPIFVQLVCRIRGRFPFYMPQSPARFRVQMLLNALTGGRVSGLAFLARSFRGTLRAKRLLIQSPAELAPDGRLIFCDHCPDATVRHGRLVPICVCDQVIDPGVSPCPSPPT